MALSQELPHSFEEALRTAKKILSKNANIMAQGSLDAEAEELVIASYRIATGELLSRADFFFRMQDRFPEAAAERVLVLAGTRAEGWPLQYLTGYKTFHNHEYLVGPDVLIPRPETEILLTSAIQELDSITPHPTLGFEVGIGSGILSVELLAHFSDLTMVASELVPGARMRARENADRILGTAPKGAERLKIVPASEASEVWQPFQGNGKADFLITNPPYIASVDEVNADVLAFEPKEALFAPPGDPLFFYKAIADQAGQWIKSGGFIFAELPHERASAIQELFKGKTWEAKILLDLNQRSRVLVAKLKS